MVAAVLSMLGADFVYVALPPRPLGRAARPRRPEMDHSAGRRNGNPSRFAQSWLGRPEQTGVIANPIGHGTVSVVAAPIGFQADAVIVAGSRRRSSPSG